MSALFAQQGPEFEVWLVDNGSSDDSVELVARTFPQVRLLPLGANLGFTGAYNRAIAACESPLVALLNNDTVVQPGWLAALAATLDGHPESAAVTSRVLFMDRPNVLNHAGGRLTLLGAAFDVGFGSPDGPAFDQADLTGCATGAALLMRKEVFQQVGEFDDSYFIYFEDADLCWRMWLRGFTVRYAPDARVLHAYGAATRSGRMSPFRVRLCQTNRLQNMFKNLEARTLLSMLPVSFGYDAMRAATYLAAGDGPAALALAQGSQRFARSLPSVLEKRRQVQDSRVRSDAELSRLGVLAGVREAAAEWRRLARQDS